MLWIFSCTVKMRLVQELLCCVWLGMISGKGNVQSFVTGSDKSTTQALNFQLVGIAGGVAEIAWLKTSEIVAKAILFIIFVFYLQAISVF